MSFLDPISFHALSELMKVDRNLRRGVTKLKVISRST
jgi:hypothetical protein